MADWMLDLETMGNKPNSAILSIGLVQFDRMTGKLGKEFYAAIDPEDALRFGVTNGDTFRWWMLQSDAARRAAVAGKEPLGAALQDIGKLIGPNDHVWANDPDFDCTILGYAFNRVLDRNPPWSFWNTRSCRTVADIAGKRPPKDTSGTHHNALDDAKHQATWVSAMLRGIKGAPAPVEPAATDLLV